MTTSRPPPGSSCSSRWPARSSSASASAWPRGRIARAHRAPASSVASFVGRGRHAHRAAGPRRGGAPGRLTVAWDYANTAGVDAQLDPGRPAGALHGARGHRRLDAHPPLLGRLHGRPTAATRASSLPELLRLLDAAAGPGGQLPPAHHRLGVRRRRVVPAHLLLVPPRRRRRARASRRSSSTWSATSASCSGTFFIFRSTGTLDFLDVFAQAPRGLRPQRRRPHRPACSCCSSARSRSPPRCRCTPGSRTPWRARPRSPR